MAEYIQKEPLLGLAEYDNNYRLIIPVEALKAAPVADVAPVVHGRWLYKHRHRGGFRTYEGCDEFGEKHSVRVDERYEIDEPYCSECGKWNESVWLNYCPTAGRRWMEA